MNVKIESDLQNVLLKEIREAVEAQSKNLRYIGSLQQKTITLLHAVIEAVTTPADNESELGETLKDILSAIRQQLDLLVQLDDALRRNEDPASAGDFAR